MIFTEKASDYKIVDVILKAWIAGLLTLWAIGMVAIISHLIMNPSAMDNATFGIFDTLIHLFNNTYIRFLLYLILGLFAFILLENQKVDII